MSRKKNKKTGLAAVSRLRSMRRMPEDAKKEVPLPEPIQVEGFAYVVDPMVQEIWTWLGGKPEDEGVAHRVAELKQAIYKTYEGTRPELVVYDWLEQNNIQFEFQAFVYGGRNRAGGIVPDFIVWPGGRGLAWFIDTNYWHTRPDVRASDVSDRIRLLGAVVSGHRIEKVVALWEDNIRFQRPLVFQLAMNGSELPK